MGKEISMWVGIIVAAIFLIFLCMWGIPTYRVWQSEMSGKAELMKAEQNRQIMIKEAEARLESEKLNALSEIERAKGMSQAMEIENGKLSSMYNQYLFIRSLEKLADKGNMPTIIYLPSEGLLPTFQTHKLE
jgi:regulator of protease activity HflC (stomatin/prohibitin superfamily)